MPTLNSVARKYFANKIGELARQGLSSYEISNILSLHPVFITAYSRQSSTYGLIYENNNTFLNKAIMLQPGYTPSELITQYNIMVVSNAIIYKGKHAASISGWLQQNKDHPLYHDIILSAGTQSISAQPQSIINSLPLDFQEKLKQLIADGVPVKNIAEKLRYSQQPIRQYINENNLHHPKSRSQIKLLVLQLKKSVSNNELKERFNHIPSNILKKWINTQVKKNKFKVTATHEAKEAKAKLSTGKKNNTPAKSKFRKTPIDLITQLGSKGNSPESIAKELNLHISIIVNTLMRLNLYKPYYLTASGTSEVDIAHDLEKKYKQGWSLPMLSKDFNLPHSKITALLSSKGFKLGVKPHKLISNAKQKSKRAAEMFAKGKSTYEIAEIFRINERTVIDMLNRLNKETQQDI